MEWMAVQAAGAKDYFLWWGRGAQKPSAMTPESRDLAGMSARAISTSQTRPFLRYIVIEFGFGHRFLTIEAPGPYGLFLGTI
jgi:hypothetical protein